MDLAKTFETEYACTRDGKMLGFARREVPSLGTVVFGGHEGSGEWRARIAPGFVRQLAARAGCSWLLGEGALYETRDGGLTFEVCSLPNRPHAVLVDSDDGPLLASGRQVISRNGDTWNVRWEVPSALPDEKISRLVALNRGVLALTNRLRIFRGVAGERSLRDYGDGLPAPLSGGAYQTPNVHVIGEWHLAYVGGLYLRRANDLAWTPAADVGAPELAGIVESQSAEWWRHPGPRTFGSVTMAHRSSSRGRAGRSPARLRRHRHARLPAESTSRTRSLASVLVPPSWWPGAAEPPSRG